MSTRKIINTTRAPAAIGPYSQAVVCGGMVYSSGQIPIDPATGEVVIGGIEKQTEQVVANLQAVLEAAGAGLKDVVKTTIFLSDMADFQAVNTAYEGRFSENPPARTTVEVSRLPLDVRIEIDAIAVVP